MKTKNLLFFIFLLFQGALNAQIIEFEDASSPFPGLMFSSIAFADVDGDNDLDLLITGDSDFGPTANLYTNDGKGNFTESSDTPFPGLMFSSIAFADVDGDNDLDLLITGDSDFGLTANLYTNDGNGIFTEVSDTPFEGVMESSIAFADVDGDNDLDLLITGDSHFALTANLYTNDGNGIFTEVSDTPFEGVMGSSIAFADVDGDNDLDLLITGDSDFDPTANLYTNDGNGNFTKFSGTPFEGVSIGSVAFADVDGDNDSDLLITGRNKSYDPIAKLYTNDGKGNFTESSGTPFEGVMGSSIAFADVDGDNDLDLLITGFNSSPDRVTKLYTNDGEGNFTESSGTPFERVYMGSVAFADVDGDKDLDLLITGNSERGVIGSLYRNISCQLIIILDSKNDLDCKGDESGSLNIKVAGGTAPYTYAWTGPDNYTSTSDAISGLSAGSYTVVVTDTNGCRTEKSYTITEPDALLVSLDSKNDLDCKGDESGSLNIKVAGGTAPYTYAWTGPDNYTSTSDAISGLSAGSYTVVVTDTKGCKTEKSYTITEPDALLVSLDSKNDLDCKGDESGSLSIKVAGGTAPYTYAWTGPDNYTSTSDAISGLSAGSYTVVVTDTKGCKTEKSYTITEPDALLVSLDSKNDLDCKGDESGSLSIKVAGGTAPYTYAWTGPDNYTSTSDAISGLSAGSYTVVVTDTKGCKTEKSYTITEPDALLVSLDSKNDLDCKGDESGSLSIKVAGGTAPYTYAWTGPDNYTSTSDAISGLSAGSYTVVVTDTKGCKTEKSYTITEPDALLVSLDSKNDLDCKGDESGSLSIKVAGGTAPYTYAWTGPDNYTSTSDAISGLSAGSYTVVVTDTKGCKTEKSYTITEPDALLVSLDSKNDLDCKGDESGSLSIKVAGGTAPYTYAWTGPDNYTSTSDAISGLSAGSYTVVVTDANGCKTEKSYTITEPDALLVSLDSKNDLDCKGDESGSLSIKVAGGTAPYTYAWTGPDNYTSTSDAISGLSAGSYTVVVTDTKGCKTEKSYTITEPDALLVSQDSKNDLDCKGDESGSLSIKVAGGTAPYTYAWTGPDNYTSTSDAISGLSAGSYTVVVTDTKGCKTEKSYTITEPENNALFSYDASEYCSNDKDPVPTIAGVGGGTFISVPEGLSIDPASGRINLEESLPSSYTVTYTTKGSCSNSFDVDITVSCVDTSIEVNDGTIVAKASGASYQWLDCDNNMKKIDGETSQSYTPTIRGSYAVEISQNGCVDTTECVTITGVLDEFSNGKPFIYPNPTRGRFTVEFGQEQEDISIQLYSILGEVIQSRVFKRKKTIDLEIEQPSGIYFVEIVNRIDKTQTVLKLIKTE